MGTPAGAAVLDSIDCVTREAELAFDFVGTQARYRTAPSVRTCPSRWVVRRWGLFEVCVPGLYVRVSALVVSAGLGLWITREF